jgi:hypothetical protein
VVSCQFWGGFSAALFASSLPMYLSSQLENLLSNSGIFCSSNTLHQRVRRVLQGTSFCFLPFSDGEVGKSFFYCFASGDGEIGGFGNGPSLFTSDTSSNSSDGMTQETTGMSAPDDIPMEKSAPILGMNSSV